MICKVCGFDKSVDNFYKGWHRYNEKSYYSYWHVCKFCVRKKREEGKTMSEIKTIELPPFQNTKRTIKNQWIYKTLKRNGNCYVNKMIDLKEIEAETNLKLKIKTADCGGYVIEVIKNDK